MLIIGCLREKVKGFGDGKRKCLALQLRDGLQILQIRKGDVVFQIVSGEIRIDDSVCSGNGLFVPHLQACTAGFREDGLCLFLSAFGFALNLGNGGSFILWPAGFVT